jgi:alcohol dehydrogenase class IV
MMLARHFNTADRKSFFTATRLYAGADARLDLGKILPDGPVLLIADTHFSGSDAASALAPAAQIQVSGEPKRRTVLELWQHLPCRDFKAVVALGGGSTIDTAKALHGLASFGVLDKRDVARPAEAPLLVAVPTTAGSGSETSRFFILADEDGVKRSYRAWSFAPDLAVLDPALLAESGRRRLLLGAFDAFMHLWETYICRNERGFETDMLALEGITLIASALEGLARDEPLDETDLAALQRASAYGGFAIANVRTGLVHTLAESLAAQVPLGHPETLYVFFQTAVDHCRFAVADRIERLDRRLAAELGAGRSFTGLCAAWQRGFEQAGISAEIDRILARMPIDLGKLATTLARDTVLFKEHPAPLTPAEMLRLVESRLGDNPGRRSSVA